MKKILAALLCAILFSCTKEVPQRTTVQKVQIRITTTFNDGSISVSPIAH